MEIAEIPSEFNSPIRLAIVGSLLDGAKTFSSLKTLTGATDGNLGAHIRKLDEAGFVLIEKTFVRKKPQTTASLTAKGKETFTSYVELLGQIVTRAKQQG